jgi:hypothetical protein
MADSENAIREVEREGKMNDDPWDKPVELPVQGSDHFHCIKNSRDAVACMAIAWPAPRDREYAMARRACLRALDGKLSNKRARAAFVAAAEKAGILPRR